jgi:hypothetical protein
MLKSVAATLLFSVVAAAHSLAATKDGAKPDPEMLKMMEFLREMEVIKQIDLLQDMHRVEAASEPMRTTPRKAEPVKPKETVK